MEDLALMKGGSCMRQFVLLPFALKEKPRINYVPGDFVLVGSQSVSSFMASFRPAATRSNT